MNRQPHKAQVSADWLIGGGEISMTLRKTDAVYELSLIGKPIGVMSQPPMSIHGNSPGQPSPYTIARSLEATEAELGSTIFPHPTLSEMLHEAVLDADKKALHI